jgi:FtsP/CotA-like multicopper oxidase with cupredoxin domain
MWASEAAHGQRFEGLATAKVTAQRTLAFNEGGGEYFIGVFGKTPVLYSPDEPPQITTTQGAVEDWAIINRTSETHAFHIHQTHFLLLQRNGSAQQQYLDTVDVPANDNIGVRIDFRGMITGDFVFHCHILEHEDHGMMAIIRVNPKP